MAGEITAVRNFWRDCRWVKPTVSDRLWVHRNLSIIPQIDGAMDLIDANERRAVSSGGLYTKEISYCCGMALVAENKIALSHIVQPSAAWTADEVQRQVDFLRNTQILEPTEVVLAQMHVYSELLNDDDALKSSLYVAVRALTIVFGDGFYKKSAYITGFRGQSWDTSCALKVTKASGVSVAMPNLPKYEE